MNKLPLYLIIGTLAIACQPADNTGTGGNDANKSVTPEKKGPAPEKKGPAPEKKGPAPEKKGSAPEKKGPAPEKKSK
jgi:hypothetical protein